MRDDAVKIDIRARPVLLRVKGRQDGGLVEQGKGLGDLSIQPRGAHAA